MRVQQAFDAQVREQIAAAVREVEKESAAEIVPVVADASGAYPQAPWRAATLGALGVPVFLTLLLRLVDFWGLPWEFWILAPAVTGSGLGFLLARLHPRIARLFITQQEMETQVRERAEHAFLTEEVFATGQRTGMLVFVSLFERQVVVLGDKGIARKVPQERWSAIAKGIAQGIGQGQPAQALIWGLHQCRQLLLEAGMVVQPGDKNELPDELRIAEEKP
ncbi:MAG: TPM domain-containing protein [Thermoanaerobaculaceae bacterium]